MTDFRALCSELTEALDECQRPCGDQPESALVWKARAALAEQPVEPTDEEIRTLADFDADFDCYETTDESGNVGDAWECSDSQLLDFARAVLARWGQPAVTPIPVSERLPGPEDCDADGRCWLLYRSASMKMTPVWSLVQSRSIFDGPYTHWLPANDLPVPAND